MKYHLSIKHSLSNTILMTAFKIWKSTDWLKSDIPSQNHPSHITLWWVILIFMSFVLSTGNTEIEFWPHNIGNMTCVSSMFGSQRFNPLKYCPGSLGNYFLVFWLGWQYLHSCLLILISTRWTGRADLFCYFRMKCSSFLSRLSFDFCLVNWVCSIFTSWSQFSL